MHDCFELSFELGLLTPEAAEAACLASGAIAITYSDAVDEPVFEPLPGEMRLWRRTRIQALYAAEQANAALIAALASRLGRAPADLAARALANRAWEREWLRDFHAMRFGERLWICPHHEQVMQPDAVIVRLDPGLAFGTGTHPSTALCLEWLDRAARSADSQRFAHYSVVDYGCGSGVLALAALCLGAHRAYAFDIDPQARLATQQNAEDNGVAAHLRVCEHDADIPRGCQVLMANILAPVLTVLSERFATLLGHGAKLLLSGILAEQEADVAQTFGKWFDITRFARRDDWVALCGNRH
jgi:ribosomal protein L11 methyltransferase